MMAPWTNKTGLAKAAAILTTVALVSLGLCGANFFGVIFFVPIGGPGGEPTPWPAYILGPAGALEIIAIVGSFIGLIVIAMIVAWRTLRGHNPEVQGLFGQDDREKEE
jgi:hypothetical protein